MRKELLPNGLLSVYDYEAQWQLLFRKDRNGKWKPHNLMAMAVRYKKLIKELNQ